MNGKGLQNDREEEEDQHFPAFTKSLHPQGYARKGEREDHKGEGAGLESRHTEHQKAGGGDSRSSSSGGSSSTIQPRKNTSTSTSTMMKAFGEAAQDVLATGIRKIFGGREDEDERLARNAQRREVASYESWMRKQIEIPGDT
ncbi:hypothetical protein CSUI_004885, partial [Cystoisospora suis]